MFIEDFDRKVGKQDEHVLFFNKLETLQVNVGNKCNQVCRHCHLMAGPYGENSMNKDVMEKILCFLKKHPQLILDITGGAPELNPHFRFLVEGASSILNRVMVRTNLTVFFEPGQEYLPDFYRDNGTVIISSLPCYLQENVDTQRGEGVYEKSIAALKKLNAIGYGEQLELNLVYNPSGASLPPNQKYLEEGYRNYIWEKFGLKFNKLFTIVNAPLGRFKSVLDKQGEYEKYLQLLESNYNPNTIEKIMCRNLISVDHQGILYNCDFNQAIGLPIKDHLGNVLMIDGLDELINKGLRIVTSNHCYCCTAGCGSSCTGALE